MNFGIKKIVKNKKVLIPLIIVLLVLGAHTYLLIRPPLEWHLDRMPRALGGQSDGFWAKVYGYRTVYQSKWGEEKARSRYTGGGFNCVERSFRSKGGTEQYHFKDGEGTDFAHLSGRVRDDARKVYDSWPEVRGATLDFTDWECRTRKVGGKTVERLLTHAGIPVELTLANEKGVLSYRWRESGELVSREFFADQQYPIEQFRLKGRTGIPAAITSGVYYDHDGKLIAEIKEGNGKLIRPRNPSRRYSYRMEAEYRDGTPVSYREYSGKDIRVEWSASTGILKKDGVAYGAFNPLESEETEEETYERTPSLDDASPDRP